MEKSLEEIIFNIIAASGDARSDFMQATRSARENNFKDALGSVTSGRAKLSDAHRVHTEIIQKEAGGEQIPYSMLLNHAQDHLMMTSLLNDMVEDIISLNQRVFQLENKEVPL